MNFERWGFVFLKRFIPDNKSEAGGDIGKVCHVL